MMIWRILLILLIILLLVGLAFSWWRTNKTQHSPNQAKFLKGTVPSPALDGFYAGTVTGYTGPWRGKKFFATDQKGINLFEESEKQVERYPFKTRVEQGLRDDLSVLKIDYNVPGNPLWVRPVLDELVQIGPNEYLGKLHYRLGLFSVALGYFSLTNSK